MYVDSEMLEYEFHQYYSRGDERNIFGYVQEALNLFLDNPVQTATGSLRWPNTDFVASANVTRQTSRSTYGYTPLKCMLLALNRLTDNRLKTAAIYERWVTETVFSAGSKTFRSSLMEKLFVEGVPASHVETFSTAEATNLSRIKICLVGTARCMRDSAPSYRWLRNIYNRWFDSIRLYSNDENRLVAACQKAAGIKRRTRKCNELITVNYEPRQWSFQWVDCSLITYGDVTYYERRDERLKWISILMWEFVCDKLAINDIPLSILLSFSN